MKYFNLSPSTVGTPALWFLITWGCFVFPNQKELLHFCCWSWNFLIFNFSLSTLHASCFLRCMECGWKLIQHHVFFTPPFLPPLILFLWVLSYLMAFFHSLYFMTLTYLLRTILPGGLWQCCFFFFLNALAALSNHKPIHTFWEWSDTFFFLIIWLEIAWCGMFGAKLVC